MGVQFGDFDAGAVAEEVFKENLDKPIRALAFSPELSTHVFVARADMEPKLRAAITRAFEELRTAPNGTEILRAISENLTGFVPAQDSDYTLHREILSQVAPALEP